jgi:hypothetical protein
MAEEQTFPTDLDLILIGAAETLLLLMEARNLRLQNLRLCNIGVRSESLLGFRTDIAAL